MGMTDTVYGERYDRCSALVAAAVEGLFPKDQSIEIGSSMALVVALAICEALKPENFLTEKADRLGVLADAVRRGANSLTHENRPDAILDLLLTEEFVAIELQTAARAGSDASP
jgi:hypothetical protein